MSERGRPPKKSYESIVNCLNEKYNFQFTLYKDEYDKNFKNTASNISLHCNFCNKNFSARLSHFLYYNTRKCPFCQSYKRHKDNNFFIEELKTVDPEYELIGKYVDSFTKITLLHKKCGNKITLLPTNFLSHKQRCPFCDSYKHESEIREYLESKFPENIEVQKMFDDCADKLKLRFDYYICNKNILIEYDGEQHFKPIYGDNEYQIMKKHDLIKNEYCKKNSINLIRIPFWEFDNFKEIIDMIVNNMDINIINDRISKSNGEFSYEQN